MFNKGDNMALTNEEILACTEPSRELDAVAAEEVMGCDPMNARHGLHPDTGELEYHWGYPLGHDIAPYYSRDIQSAFTLQARIEELGLWHPFISWLWELTTKGEEGNYSQEEDMWDCANASALSRTKAAILAVRKGE